MIVSIATNLFPHIQYQARNQTFKKGENVNTYAKNINGISMHQFVMITMLITRILQSF